MDLRDLPGGDQEREWQKPELKRIEAGSAENSAGVAADAGENLS